MNTKTIALVIIIFILSFSATFFIIKSNDHKECNTLEIKRKDTNGNLIVSQKHICKEKYSF
jgi:uncharacterized membrane protein